MGLGATSWEGRGWVLGGAVDLTSTMRRLKVTPGF